MAITAGGILYAQSFELGFTVGSSLDLSCLADTGADIAMVFSIPSGLDIGFGTGLRFASPIYRKTVANTITSADKVSRDYSADLTLPLFSRLRYRFPANFFLQIDSGYRFGLASVCYGKGWAPANSKKSTFNGIIIEPQAGFHLDSRRSLSFGMTLQQYSRGDARRSSSAEHSSYEYRTVNRWSPIVFIRYSILL